MAYLLHQLVHLLRNVFSPVQKHIFADALHRVHKRLVVQDLHRNKFLVGRVHHHRAQLRHLPPHRFQIVARFHALLILLPIALHPVCRRLLEHSHLFLCECALFVLLLVTPLFTAQRSVQLLLLRLVDRLLLLYSLLVQLLHLAHLLIAELLRLAQLFQLAHLPVADIVRFEQGFQLTHALFADVLCLCRLFAFGGCDLGSHIKRHFQRSAVNALAVAFVIRIHKAWLKGVFQQVLQPIPARQVIQTNAVRKVRADPLVAVAGLLRKGVDHVADIDRLFISPLVFFQTDIHIALERPAQRLQAAVIAVQHVTLCIRRHDQRSTAKIPEDVLCDLLVFAARIVAAVLQIPPALDRQRIEEGRKIALLLRPHIVCKGFHIRRQLSHQLRIVLLLDAVLPHHLPRHAFQIRLLRIHPGKAAQRPLNGFRRRVERHIHRLVRVLLHQLVKGVFRRCAASRLRFIHQPQRIVRINRRAALVALPQPLLVLKIIKDRVVLGIPSVFILQLF